MDQFEQIKGMGSLEQIMGMLPGVKPGALKDVQVDEKAIDRMQAIIRSMTPAERRKPSIIDLSRKKRIAAGSGNSIDDVNRLLKQFESISKLMKQMSGVVPGKGRGLVLPGMGGKGKGKNKKRMRF